MFETDSEEEDEEEEKTDDELPKKSAFQVIPGVKWVFSSLPVSVSQSATCFGY